MAWNLTFGYFLATLFYKVAHSQIHPCSMATTDPFNSYSQLPPMTLAAAKGPITTRSRYCHGDR